MLTRFSQHISSNFSFLKDKKLLIAISGGIDSVVLTQLLHKLKFNIHLAHCNFHLRGRESDQDEIFVRHLAKNLQAQVYINSFDTELIAKKEKLSIQLMARKLRYVWFNELIRKNNLDYIITAHHVNDNFETFLINFIRGTGLDGLTGIPEINNYVIRPLLPFSREEIEIFAKENAIHWRDDCSNNETKYLRNKIRHDVIPVLKELNPNLLASFRQTMENLKGSRQIIDDAIEKISNEVFFPAEAGIAKLNIERLKKLENLKAYLYELLNDYGFTEWNDIVDLMDAQSGKQVLSKTYRLVKDRNNLLLTKICKDKDNLQFSISESDLEFKAKDIKLEISSAKNLSQYSVDRNILYIDKDKVKYPIIVRKWEKGDYFYPLGMFGKKKLSKYFKDEKLSILKKEKIWLLCSENQIVWIIGMRPDDRFKLTNKTKNILKIEFIK